jgi:hypothetical protein
MIKQSININHFYERFLIFQEYLLSEQQLADKKITRFEPFSLDFDFISLSLPKNSLEVKGIRL